ncbi:hypothetical protein [Aeromonas salmonicida]|uniref:hypothetical protein n=1 Tax=Aeromonas salmonicida TaxID=645 RepID=UPI003D193982
MLKITGLDKFQKELAEAQRVLEELDGELGTVNFHPHEPASQPVLKLPFSLFTV